MEFKIFIEKEAAFFVGYVVSQSEQKVAKGIRRTFVFFVEELSLTLCESTSDDELVCEVGIRFADCGNGDVVTGGEVSAAAGLQAKKTTNMHSLAPFIESFLRR